jgi:hypothetical protein
VINDWIFRDIRIASAANTEGIAYILECGHENNAEVEKEFHEIKKQHPDISELMRSISFVGKRSCRAIQMADLLACYSRRDSAALYEAHRQNRDSYEIDVMIKIIVENLPHRGFVATDFGPDASGSRFLAGDP